ncbi:porin [Vibrio sp. 99-70-13A1]|uniref:porin n=1 Tax=Vibrio sp. 99-70-13A1 TaxID=2607601 RepID=UPI001493DB3A|nr:porin [Vibrio sp. 99-70-13A1]NOH95283.1 porin [Vibrio sp. 99-70-13A1]
MKKTLLALAVVTAAGSVSAAEIYKTDEGTVDFYGQLRTELKFLDDKDPTLGSGSSRAGVDAQYNVSDDLKVLGKVEFALKDSGDMYVRNHIAGLSSDSVGTIKLGKQWTLSDDVYGADYSYFFGGSALLYSTLNSALHDSQVKYSYDADNFWVKLGYGFDEDSSNQELVEVYAGTSFGDFSVHVGGGQVNDDVVGSTHEGLEHTYYEGTVEYSKDALTLGATLAGSSIESANDKADQTGITLGAMYGIADKTTVYGGYEFVSQDHSALEDSDVIYVGVEYKYASWARVYAEYGYADGDTLGFNRQGTDAVVAPQSVDGASNFGIGARVYW